MIRVLNKELFRLVCLSKRDSDWKRDHEKEAVDGYFNKPQRSNTQNVAQNIPYRGFSEGIVIGENEPVERKRGRKNDCENDYSFHL